jgi:hypothetical protein
MNAGVRTGSSGFLTLPIETDLVLLTVVGSTPASRVPSVQVPKSGVVSNTETTRLLVKNRDYTHNPVNECKRLWLLKKSFSSKTD